MAGTASPSDFNTAISLLYHVYFRPVMGTLVRHRVPDHLAEGPLPAAELAERAGLHALSLTRALRALEAFGAFKEVSPGIFGHNPVSELFRDRPGGLRNMALYTSSDHSQRSVAALGQSVVTGRAATAHVFSDPFQQLTPLGRLKLADFGRKPKHGETVRAVPETGIDLSAHQPAVDPTG